MTIVTNTFLAFSAVGNREALSNIIYNVDPTDTPFMTGAGRGKATGVFEEWQTEALAAAAANAQLEGDDYTYTAVAATVRVGNRCQISNKRFIVSGTQETVEKAGRKSEIAHQIQKNGKELKRDMELALCANNASVTGNSTTARVLGGMAAWITTNNSFGSGGSDGGFSGSNVVATTDGTQRAFTEAQLKSVQQQCWTSGGKPDVCMVGAHNKQVASGFSGIATQYRENKGTKQATIVGAADVYVGDFGEFKIIANRFSPSRTALLVDFDYVDVLYLRPFMTEKLAKTGDGEKRAMLAEYTLKVGNEKAHGAVYDLTTS